jgi:hypothetical protein
MLLSPHFNLSEFTQSERADLLEIPNLPSQEEIEALRALCVAVLEPARVALGRIYVSSGFRSEALNRAVRGAPESQHRRGEAADVVPLDAEVGDLLRFVVRSTPFDLTIWEHGGRWVHVSYSASRPARGSVLRALTGQSGKTIYRPIEPGELDSLRRGVA